MSRQPGFRQDTGAAAIFSGFNTARRRIELFCTALYENGVWLAFIHPKRTLIIDPRGNIVAKNSGEGNQIVMAKVTISEGKPVQLLRERRPGLYEEIAMPRQ